MVVDINVFLKNVIFHFFKIFIISFVRRFSASYKRFDSENALNALNVVALSSLIYHVSRDIYRGLHFGRGLVRTAATTHF